MNARTEPATIAERERRPASTAAPTFAWSLRAKGLLAFVAVIGYVIITGAVLDVERQRLRKIAVDLEALHQKEASLSRTMHAINHALLRAQALLASGALASSAGDDIGMDLELIQSGLQELQSHFPEFDDDVERLGREGLALRRDASLGALAALHDSERALDIRLTEIDGAIRGARDALWSKYHEVYDRMTLIGVAANLIGMLSVGSLITIFFTRLAWDIRKLGERAESIVAGYRGTPLPVTRRDEVGTLMSAVNRMQLELREREQKLELARERHYHREKMAAVGSLASAVAHEINNPIAAIAGIAQAMSDAEREDATHSPPAVPGGAEMILAQTQRISAISRQIAEFTRPPTATPELMDLNALVRNTCKFAAYDKRLRGVAVDVDLDNSLPAISAVADHVSQVLMNLLINSADALQGLTSRPPAIRVATRVADESVILTVADNGHGMDAATLARVFEESFTTKSTEAGRGLGLFVCRALVERDGGSIAIESTPDAGTVATVTLPIESMLSS